jgi:hypothetical protein
MAQVTTLLTRADILVSDDDIVDFELACDGRY